MKAKPIEENEWEVDEAIRTLKRAAEIEADEKMMRKIRPRMKRDIRSLKELEARINAMNMKAAQEEIRKS